MTNIVISSSGAPQSKNIQPIRREEASSIIFLIYENSSQKFAEILQNYLSGAVLILESVERPVGGPVEARWRPGGGLLKTPTCTGDAGGVGHYSPSSQAGERERSS